MGSAFEKNFVATNLDPRKAKGLNDPGPRKTRIRTASKRTNREKKAFFRRQIQPGPRWKDAPRKTAPTTQILIEFWAFRACFTTIFRFSVSLFCFWLSYPYPISKIQPLNREKSYCGPPNKKSQGLANAKYFLSKPTPYPPIVKSSLREK